MPVLSLSLLPCFVLGAVLAGAEARPARPADRFQVAPAAGPSACGESRAARVPERLSPPAPEHRFADRQNLLLFAAVGASRGLDYSSTLNMRRRGRQEVFLTNDLVDNHPAFAAVEAGGVALSIAASYLFHRTHHHRLERWVSIVHAGLSTAGAVRNYSLKTVGTSPAP